MSFHTAYSDTGLWGLFASVPYNKVEDFCYELTQEWMRISQAATETEVNRAKAMLRAATLFSGDSSQAINDEIGRQVLTLGRRMTPAEIDARINVCFLFLSFIFWACVCAPQNLPVCAIHPV